MTNLLLYLLGFSLLSICICDAQPSRFCSRLARDCTTECRENGTLGDSLLGCAVDCICMDSQIIPLFTYEECIATFEDIRSSCSGRTCGLGRFFNDFCTSLPGKCCDPNELDLFECENNSTETLCCDGEWICANEENEFNCADRLINKACCCDPTDTLACYQGSRQCCPNDGQWTCPINFPPTFYTCSDGNIYTRNEMADECCCDPTEEPGRFGNPPCFEGVVCCPDGTWSCGIGDGTFSCGGDPLPFRQIPQGERCVCDGPYSVFQVVICCDGITFLNPAAAQMACYDIQDEELCSYQFNILPSGRCQPY